MICYNFDNCKYIVKCKNWLLNYKKVNMYIWKKKWWVNEFCFDKINWDYVFV